LIPTFSNRAPSGPFGVDRRQGDAGDGRWQGERQVDQGVDQAAEGKAVAHQHPGDQQAHRRVHRRRRRGDQEADPQGGQDAFVGQRRPDVVDAILPRANGERGERDEDD
jgi:hypothetical protein